MPMCEEKWECKEHDQEKWVCVKTDDGYECHIKRAFQANELEKMNARLFEQLYYPTVIFPKE